MPVELKQINSAKSFYDAIAKAKRNNPHGAFVTQYEVSDYQQDELFLSEDNNVGVAVTPDGDIISVFKNPDYKGKKAVSSILLTALENGGIKLDNFNGGLSQMYWQHGFVPVARTTFVRKFAPDDWNYERDGEPDIIFWMHNGDSAENVANKIGDYGEIPDLTKLPLMEYEKAAEYRDGVIKKRQHGNTKYSIPSEIDKKYMSAVAKGDMDNNGNVIPLSERFKADNKDIRYSLDEDENTHQYTKEVYNAYGWAVSEGILEAGTIERLISKIMELNNLHYKFNKTKSDNQYIIPMSNERCLYNYLIYTDNDAEMPHITKIIEIVETDDRITQLWEDLLNERKYTEGYIQSKIKIIQDSFSDSFFEYTFEDSLTYTEYLGERQNNERKNNDGTVRRESKSTVGNGFDGKRTDTESNGISEGNFGGDISFSLEEQEFNKNTEADLKEPAFSMLNEQYSLPETEAVLKRKIEQLQADNKHLVKLVNLNFAPSDFSISLFYFSVLTLVQYCDIISY